MTPRTKKSRAMKGRRPRPSEICPCGSGKVFARCCAKQQIKWKKRPDGSWAKVLPLVPEVLEVINAEAAEFKELFGRAMRGSDFLFWRQHAQRKRDILYCPCQEGKAKKFIFCKNSKLESRSDFGNTFPFESHYEFAFNSTNLSPITNSESQRYQYPVCPAKAEPPIIPYPDSKVEREALDCPPRGPFIGLYVGARALSSKMKNLFIRRLDKPD